MKRNNPTIPNAAQQKAVDATDYPILLEAGAGSGKTKSLVAKVIHILENDPAASLERMAIITFTNKATDELVRRLQDELYQHVLNHPNSPNAQKINHQISLCSMAKISTIHGFCEQILRDYGHVIGLANTFDTVSSRQNLDDIITQTLAKVADMKILQGIPQYTLLSLVKTLLEHAKNQGIELEHIDLSTLEFDTPNNVFFNRFKPIILRVCKAVSLERKEQKTYGNKSSSDDWVSLALSILDNPYACTQVAYDFPYIFMDEFQDTDKQQFQLMEKLISAGVRAFIIGDKKQSIYGFRGADAQNASRIAKIVGTDGTVALNTNYRTDPTLLRKINRIFSKKFSYGGIPLNFPREPMESGRTSDLCENPLRIILKKKIADTVQEIKEQEKIGGREVLYSDIAILCRRNFELKQVAHELETARIPVEVRGGRGFYATKEIIDTFKLLSAIIYQSRTSLLEAENTFYHRAMLQSEITQNFTDFLTGLDEIIKVHPIDIVLSTIYERTGAITYLRSCNQVQAVANLQKLADKAKSIADSGLAKPLQFLEYLDRMISSNKEEDEAEVSQEDRAKGVVTLSTIHKAKGLEFPVVVIPYADLPLVRKNNQPKVILTLEGDKLALALRPERLVREWKLDADYKAALSHSICQMLEEELRVFYVACTRAESLLILSCNDDEKQIMWLNRPSWAQWAGSVEEDI